MTVILSKARIRLPYSISPRFPVCRSSVPHFELRETINADRKAKTLLDLSWRKLMAVLHAEEMFGGRG